MSKGPHRRDPDTGLRYALFEQLDERLLDDSGRLRPEFLATGWHWNTASLAAEVTSLKRPDRLVAAAEADPAYPWVPLTKPAGRVLVRGTMVSSFAAWAASHKAATRAVQSANLRQGTVPPAHPEPSDNDS